MLELLVLALLFFTGLLILLYRRLSVRHERLRLDLQEADFRAKSMASRFGKMTEQFIPLLESYPYDKQNFRFLGTPIDGIQFEPDRVVLVEFKSSGSRLSARQREIRKLVEKGKVEFAEIRLPEAK